MTQFSERHAYLIAAHDKPAQLMTLLRLLDDPQNDVFLHVDKKAKWFSAETLSACVKRASLTFVPRQNALWGSPRFIDAICSVLSAAVQTEHAYYHFLSGADLPLKPQSEIRAFFAAHAGKEFVAFNAETPDEAMISARLSQFHLHLPPQPLLRALARNAERVLFPLQRTLGINRIRHAPVVFQIGAVWFSITHALAEYVVRQAPQYRKYWRGSMCADEIFLQTILFDSPFMQSRHFVGYGDECAATMRYVDWSAGGRSPRTLTSADYDMLMDSGLLFARKFDETVDDDVIKRIAEAVG